MKIKFNPYFSRSLQVSTRFQGIMSADKTYPIAFLFTGQVKSKKLCGNRYTLY